MSFFYRDKVSSLCNRRSLFFIHFFIFLFVAESLFCVADWTFLVYVQAKNSLSNFAHKNFADMATVGSNKKLNILVEWHSPGQYGIWRYKIESEKMVLDHNEKRQTDGNSSRDLIDSMRWAVTKYPAKKYALILWNHGIGILDPSWGNSMNIINPKSINNNPKIQIEGLSTPFNNTFSCEKIPVHRGILFNEYSRTYMNNQELTFALSTIKKDILKGKKIDLLGMDACLMAMVEIAYQVRHYADYLVASQEVELAYGWDYGTIFGGISHGTMDSSDVAQFIVKAYEVFYKDRINFYTQSAINLAAIDKLKTSIDCVISSFYACKDEEFLRTLFAILKRARSRCLQFSAPTYVDLHSFLFELNKQITFVFDKKFTGSKMEHIANLKNVILESMYVIEEVVIANTSGKYLSKAKGLSIYFPQFTIEESYAKTEFAQDSSWPLLMSKYVHGY
jgi:hypothetical protein